ncbi:hypothetical protein DL96DRAFT_557170 [Flagelloscypha sp. PMI_526]|nr:hypothetical protein DL96DRAFT_557170 [Flagelloscypha sp. PMI_526]
MGATALPDACTSEWTNKSCFIYQSSHLDHKNLLSTGLPHPLGPLLFLSLLLLSTFFRPQAKCERILHQPCRLSRQLPMLFPPSFKLQPHTVPVELIQDSLIFHQENCLSECPTPTISPQWTSSTSSPTASTSFIWCCGDWTTSCYQTAFLFTCSRREQY